MRSTGSNPAFYIRNSEPLHPPASLTAQETLKGAGAHPVPLSQPVLEGLAGLAQRGLSTSAQRFHALGVPFSWEAADGITGGWDRAAAPAGTMAHSQQSAEGQQEPYCSGDLYF